MKIECKNCGSEFELNSKSIPLRDKDSINCEVCRSELYSWNEAKMWEATLLEKKENHLNKPR